MIYDGVNTKPPLNDDTLQHYGVKGMKWGKTKKGKMREGQKAERKTKFRRWNKNLDPSTITDEGGRKVVNYGSGLSFKEQLGIGSKNRKSTNEMYKRKKIYGGTANSLTGGTGVRVTNGLAAGRSRNSDDIKKRKQNIVKNKKKKQGYASSY